MDACGCLACVFQLHLNVCQLHANNCIERSTKLGNPSRSLTIGVAENGFGAWAVNTFDTQFFHAVVSIMYGIKMK